ncbi:hypothetical protein [Streptomyces sp. NRRL S-350]|uniref:hypothetical protein n=1 Tax=Streptomyces sp. NRRL S-350 TaxID=1463902 RepID=UPI000B16F253|nr:hypothetical protein [Streptomyces sp. NRRL S-350]
MRRAAATCLLVTAAALAGCASGTPAGSKAVATLATASASASAAPAASTTASTVASPSASDSSARAWALNSPQYSAVTSAFIPMAATIMSAHGDTAKVGQACTTMAKTVIGQQPEAGSPAEWGQALGDLQKAAKLCDAVTAGDADAYDQLQDDFSSAMNHLKPLTD